MKLHCLGANRVAFGTLAMVSIGCTICRGCQLDTCHVGIATQIESMEEAEQKGLKKFTPQEFEPRRRELRALLRRDGRGGAPGRRRASATSARRTWSAAATCSSSRARKRRDRPDRDDPPARGDARPRADRHAGERRGGARGGRPDRRAADPDGGEGGLARARRAGDGRLRRPGQIDRRRQTPAAAGGRGRTGRGGTATVVARVPAAGRRQRPRARHRARGRALAGADLPARTPRPTSTMEPRRRPALQRRLDRRLRASARSTSGASTSASRAARRTASARRCSAARSRS